MGRFTRTVLAAAVVAAAAGPVLATGGAATTAPAAASAGTTILPFLQVLRRCDFSEMQYVGATGYGHGSALVGRQGGEEGEARGSHGTEAAMRRRHRCVCVDGDRHRSQGFGPLLVAGGKRSRVTPRSNRAGRLGRNILF